jgi:hypothetical protein
MKKLEKISLTGLIVGAAVTGIGIAIAEKQGVQNNFLSYSGFTTTTISGGVQWGYNLIDGQKIKKKFRNFYNKFEDFCLEKGVFLGKYQDVI